MNSIKEFAKLNFANRMYLIFIGCYWLLGGFSAFWRRLGIVDSGVTIANLLLLLLLALLCAKKWNHWIRFSDVVLYLLFLLIYFLNVILYPRTEHLIYHYAIDVALGTIPFFFVGLIFRLEGMKEWLLQFARITILINIVYSYVSASDLSDSEEQMNRAYVLLPSVLYVLWHFLDRFNAVDFVFFLIGFIDECSMGTRGPFVCVLFFAAIFLFFFKQYKHPILARILIVVMVGLLYLSYSSWGLIMILLLTRMGGSTRIFDFMLDDSLMNYENSSGRDRIQGNLLHKLNDDHEWTGYGLLADHMEDGYAHNIFVELWYSYGYVIGSIVISMILLLFLIQFVKTRDRNVKMISILFFTASFFKLMFSGSFILDRDLFFLIGFCISSLREAKRYAKRRVEINSDRTIMGEKK